MPGLARGQERYPSRPIRIIVPRAPGGGSDILARLLAPPLGQQLNATVVVENRPDATAIVGAEATARSAPDGYTLYIADNSFYFNPSIIPRLPYDTAKDFAGVTMLAQAPVVLMTRPDFEAKDLKSLIAYGKANPGHLTYASGGVGASTHFAGVLMGLRADIEMVHVPYRSSGPAMTALLGGEVTMNFGGFASGAQLIRAGTVRPIAATHRAADPNLPPVPSFEELGLPGVDVASLWGIHAPAGTPMEIRTQLADTFRAIMTEPGFKAKLLGMGYEPICNAPEEHQVQTAQIVSQWIEIGKRVDLNR
ncbi:tripartite tricarboxylate transporter substrate binding protein [Belnapia sp. T6]|uniref:Tripartite tricarboxylate transporter substrate binding protein n=1 Tax=Belnapia mucosa TaxID=2804532 RepID=A0ABS1UXL5_9PROT|nr:tripartite tricarboxylate transporter substrate binding protein [Belnapia mucosa]MBL6454062.1 tripartite tricarboxylate transporter substrate binding protein [Belnapia mucosa]